MSISAAGDRTVRITLFLLVLLAILLLSPGAALAETGDGQAVAGSVEIPAIWWVAPASAILALVFAWVFYIQVKRANEGDEKMKEIAAHVRDGAYAYLKRQYKV
ncbi:MAG: sodium/proton-translocating pyrophosphatase, partial [Phycisphaerae bacterium]|nr:sodium/proton-translocating pyrophosphatase [Phycisphaerae bacterium]